MPASDFNEPPRLARVESAIPAWLRFCHLKARELQPHSSRVGKAELKARQSTIDSDVPDRILSLVSRARVRRTKTSQTERIRCKVPRRLKSAPEQHTNSKMIRVCRTKNGRFFSLTFILEYGFFGMKCTNHNDPKNYSPVLLLHPLVNGQARCRCKALLCRQRAAALAVFNASVQDCSEREGRCVILIHKIRGMILLTSQSERRLAFPSLYFKNLSYSFVWWSSAQTQMLLPVAPRGLDHHSAL